MHQTLRAYSILGLLGKKGKKGKKSAVLNSPSTALADQFPFTLFSLLAYVLIE